MFCCDEKNIENDGENMLERYDYNDLPEETIILIASFLRFDNAEHEYKKMLNLYDLARLAIVNKKTHKAVRKTPCFGFGMWKTFEEASNGLKHCASHTIARLLFPGRPPTYEEKLCQSECAIKWFSLKPGDY